MGRETASRAEREKKTSGGALITYPSIPRDDASQTASGGSQTLGLSGEDLLYVLLALGALALSGVLTRRLARATRPEGSL